MLMRSGGGSDVVVEEVAAVVLGELAVRRSGDEKLARGQCALLPSIYCARLCNNRGKTSAVFNARFNGL